MTAQDGLIELFVQVEIYKQTHLRKVLIDYLVDDGNVVLDDTAFDPAVLEKSRSNTIVVLCVHDFLAVTNVVFLFLGKHRKGFLLLGIILLVVLGLLQFLLGLLNELLMSR